jgi:hypothetical protein
VCAGPVREVNFSLGRLKSKEGSLQLLTYPSSCYDAMEDPEESLSSLGFVDRLSGSARGFGDGFRSSAAPPKTPSSLNATVAELRSKKAESSSPFAWLARDLRRDPRALNSALDRGDASSYIRAAHAAVAPALPEGVAPVGEFITALTQLCQKRGWPNPAFKIGTTLKADLKFAAVHLMLSVTVPPPPAVDAAATAAAAAAPLSVKRRRSGGASAAAAAALLAAGSSVVEWEVVIASPIMWSSRKPAQAALAWGAMALLSTVVLPWLHAIEHGGGVAALEAGPPPLPSGTAPTWSGGGGGAAAAAAAAAVIAPAAVASRSSSSGGSKKARLDPLPAPSTYDSSSDDGSEAQAASSDDGGGNSRGKAADLGGKVSGRAARAAAAAGLLGIDAGAPADLHTNVEVGEEEEEEGDTKPALPSAAAAGGGVAVLSVGSSPASLSSSPSEGMGGDTTGSEGETQGGSSSSGGPNRPAATAAAAAAAAIQAPPSELSSSSSSSSSASPSISSRSEIQTRTAAAAAVDESRDREGGGVRGAVTPAASAADSTEFDSDALKRRSGGRYFGEEGSSAQGRNVRCYRCREMGHTAITCPNAAAVQPCHLCGCDDHKAPQCPAADPCWVCDETGHRAGDCSHRRPLYDDSRASPRGLPQGYGRQMVMMLGPAAASERGWARRPASGEEAKADRERRFSGSGSRGGRIDAAAAAAAAAALSAGERLPEAQVRWGC